MAEHQQPASVQEPDPCAACDPRDTPAGPPREAGGTTGEGNLSPQQASRTGGATGGAGTDAQKPARAGTIPPDA